MAVTLSGFGQFFFRDSTNEEIQPFRPNAFTLSKEVESEDILYYPNSGINTLQTLTTITTSTTWNLSVESGWLSDQTLPFIFDQRLTAAASTGIVKSQVSTIPATSPYTVTITGLTLDQTDVRCTLISNTLGDTYMTRVANTPGAAASGQFDVSVDTVTFDSTDAGKTVLITYDDSESVETIGGEATAAPIGTIEFVGKLKSSVSTFTWGIWLKEIKLAEGLEFGSANDNTTFNFVASTPSDWNNPFKLFKLT